MINIKKHLIVPFITVFFGVALGTINFLSSFNIKLALSLRETGWPGAAALFFACVSIVLAYTLFKNKDAIKPKNNLSEPTIQKQTFPNTDEMDIYTAKRIEEAQKEVCSFLWQDNTEDTAPSTLYKKESQEKLRMAISKFCGKGYTYREVFTFTFELRVGMMKERLDFGKNYQCRYYDNFKLKLKERFPKLQFRIIDDEEVIFASKGFTGAICAFKDRELVIIMKRYFNVAWENAIEISNSDKDKQREALKELDEKLSEYKKKNF